jgi:hypothetical protein
MKSGCQSLMIDTRITLFVVTSSWGDAKKQGRSCHLDPFGKHHPAYEGPDRESFIAAKCGGDAELIALVDGNVWH